MKQNKKEIQQTWKIPWRAFVDVDFSNSFIQKLLTQDLLLEIVQNQLNISWMKSESWGETHSHSDNRAPNNSTTEVNFHQLCTEHLSPPRTNFRQPIVLRNLKKNKNEKLKGTPLHTNPQTTGLQPETT